MYVVHHSKECILTFSWLHICSWLYYQAHIKSQVKAQLVFVEGQSKFFCQNLSFGQNFWRVKNLMEPKYFSVKSFKEMKHSWPLIHYDLKFIVISSVTLQLTTFLEAIASLVDTDWLVDWLTDWLTSRLTLTDWLTGNFFLLLYFMFQSM